MQDSRNSRFDRLTALLNDGRRSSTTTAGAWWTEFFDAVCREPAIRSYVREYPDMNAFALLLKDAVREFESRALSSTESATWKSFLPSLAAVGVDPGWWRFEMIGAVSDIRIEETLAASRPPDVDEVPDRVSSLRRFYEVLDESTPTVLNRVSRVLASLAAADSCRELSYEHLSDLAGLTELAPHDEAGAVSLLMEILAICVKPDVDPDIRKALVALGAECLVRSLAQEADRNIAAPVRSALPAQPADRVEIPSLNLLLSNIVMVGRGETVAHLSVHEQRVLRDWLLISATLHERPLVLAAQAESLVRDPSKESGSGLAALCGLALISDGAERRGILEVIARRI